MPSIFDNGGYIGVTASYGQYSMISDGLVLAMDAGDSKSYPGTGTTWFDTSSSSLSGVLTNGPTYSSDGGGSIAFDGVNDGVLISSPAQLSVNQHTISCWCYSANFNQNGFMFEKTTNGSVNTQYSLFFSGSNLIYYRTYGLSITDFTTTTSTYVVNSQWNNIIATYDGSAKKIYVNGILVATQSVTGTVTQNTTGSAYIGIYGNFGGYPFNGKISTMRVYDRALSFSEIQKNYNATKGRFGL